MKNIAGAIAEHFFKKEQAEIINHFADYNIRVEGWFHGELIKLFIDNGYTIESTCKPTLLFKKRRPDFVILDKKDNKYVWEIKAIVIENKANKARNIRKIPRYFKDEEGLAGAFGELKISKYPNEYILVFAYPMQKEDVTNKWAVQVSETQKQYGIKEIKRIHQRNLLISLWGK